MTELPRADRHLAWRAGTGECPMKPEPSKLAPLVIAYYEKFGDHVPGVALRQFDAGDLAVLIRGSLATGVPISEAEWCYDAPLEYAPGGCIIREEDT